MYIKDEFLARCKYHAMKSYEDKVAMAEVNKQLDILEAKHESGVANRLYYFAIPPNVFLSTAVSQFFFFFSFAFAFAFIYFFHG
jgi:glucose-6-phosphate 1-dehydrogenase